MYLEDKLIPSPFQKPLYALQRICEDLGFQLTSSDQMARIGSSQRAKKSIAFFSATVIWPLRCCDKLTKKPRGESWQGAHKSLEGLL